MKNRFTSALGMLFSTVVLLAFALGNAHAQTYCTPSNSSSTDGIGIVLTQNGLNNTNISNTSTFSSGGYAAYLSDSVAALQGTSFNLQAQSINSASYHWAVWIDWNEDGDFNDANEQVYVNNNNYSTSLTTSIYVSYAVTAGIKRMRIIGGNTTISSPCMSSSYIEGEDYTLKVVAAPACSGQPTAGAIASSSLFTICPGVSFSLTDTGATGASNMTYQWQERNPSGTGAWTDIAGAINFNLDFPNGITSSMDYRFYVVCNNSNQSDTSNVVHVVINQPTDCYCTPDFSNNYPTYMGYAYLSEVKTTGGSVNIDKTSNFNYNGYSDYRNTDTLRAMGGDSIKLSATISTTYTYTPSAGLMAWIDWNHDGDFNDAGEVVGRVNSQVITNAYNTAFQVPVTSVPGRTTLRVMTYYYADNFSPCGTGLSTYGFGEAEDYTVIIDSMPGCAAATFPTSVQSLVNVDSLCVTGDVTLDLDTVFYFSSVTYQWQESSTGTGGWTDVDTPQLAPEKTITGISSDVWYRCKVLCSGNTAVTSSVIHIHVNNPQLTGAPQGGSRCGPGTVGLSASISSGSSGVSWYESPTGGGAPFAKGTNVQSPYIVKTDTFWAAPRGGNVPDTTWIGTGTSMTTGPTSPFYTYYMGHKSQYLIKASELQAAGFREGTITSIGFKVEQVTTTLDLTDFTIKVGETSVNALTSTWETGLTTVYTNPSYTIKANQVNTFAFTTPIVWDGTSNIVIETCFNNSNYGGYQYVYYNYGLSFQASHYAYEDSNPNFCTTPGGNTGITTDRPNIQLGVKVPCEGGREAVVAIVTPGPPFAISYDSVICNNTLRPISVSSPLNNYTDGYTWTVLDATGSLYTDAAGTTPYVSGTSASTVYYKSSVSGLHRIAVHASNGPLQSDCAAADTADIWVQPGNVSVVSIPDTVCMGGPTDLSLNPNNNYWPGTVQWQESATGVNYNTIPNSIGTTYTTVSLSTPHYYRALISAQAGLCLQPDKQIMVANPVVLAARDSFNCGPGPVTLTAVTGGNSYPVWYVSDTASQPIGSGTPFATPPLTSTDTFYMAARGGAASVPGSFVLGKGTSTLTSVYTGFYSYYGNETVQYLITKDELKSLGFSGGAILSLGINVATAYYPNYIYKDFRISMKNSSMTTMTAGVYETGMQTVYGPHDINFASTGWRTFTFDQPFVWDGSSNVVVQWCWSNNNLDHVSQYPYLYGDLYNSNVINYLYSSMAITPNDICSQNITSGGYSSYRYRPQFQFGYLGPCESARVPVVAKIFPKPDVDLGPDLNECVDSGFAMVLDAGVQQYSPQFLWDNNTISQVRSINKSGVYYVTVTNSYTCQDRDTIDIVLRINPDVDLGGDTTVCENTSVTLDAGKEGIQYFWNTGANTQTITVSTPGTYNVLVTNDEGCTDGDTVRVDMSGQMPHYDGIMITNNGIDTFTFNPLNPQGVVGYEWDFGDGSPHKFGSVVHHRYKQPGTYIVTLEAISNCGSYVDSTSAHILGIGDLNLDNNQLAVYPNPTKAKATIVTKGVKMEKIVVYNVLGQKIYEAKADSPYEHELDLSGVASGVYNIRVYTESGVATRKLNVLK